MTSPAVGQPRRAARRVWETFRDWSVLSSQRSPHQSRNIRLGRLLLPRPERWTEEDRGARVSQAGDLQRHQAVGALGQVGVPALAGWAGELLCLSEWDRPGGSVSPLCWQAGGDSNQLMTKHYYTGTLQYWNMTTQQQVFIFSLTTTTIRHNNHNETTRYISSVTKLS